MLKVLISSMFLLSVGCVTLTEEERFEREYADADYVILQTELMAECTRGGGLVMIFKRGLTGLGRPFGRWDRWECGRKW